MQTMKVVDYNKMPQAAQDQFFDYYETKINDNAYIEHSVLTMGDCKNRLNLVDEYLLSIDMFYNESVLIHWFY